MTTATPNAHGTRIGKRKALFTPAPRLHACAGSRPSRAVLAQAPGHCSSPPPWRAARRSAAEHGLDMPPLESGSHDRRVLMV